jgi:AcrR family transcriptional regulator
LAKSEKAPSPVGRSELINIALDLFSQHGFVGTSIRDIANEAGKSVSNIYHYFENKEAIWLAILEKSFDGLAEKLATELASRSDPLEAIEALLRAHLAISSQFYREHKMLILGPLVADAWQESKRIQQSIVLVYETALRRLAADRPVRFTDPKITALNIVGTVYWKLFWFESVRRLSAEEVTDEIVRFAVGGLCPT